MESSQRFKPRNMMISDDDYSLLESLGRKKDRSRSFILRQAIKFYAQKLSEKEKAHITADSSVPV